MNAKNEWYTPPALIEDVRAAFGGHIDTDPCTATLPQTWIGARHAYTEADDGLSRSWFGNVYINPPYSGGLVGAWSDEIVRRLDDQNVMQMIVLVNSRTGTRWMQPLLEHADAVCFVSPRIRFIDVNGEQQRSPRYDNAILYFGPDPTTFAEVFDTRGTIMSAFNL